MKVEDGRSTQSRVVIDTNVWLSAALSPGGAPAKVLKADLPAGAGVVQVIDAVLSDQQFSDEQAY